MEWMINTQLGRRNLPPQQRIAVVKKFEKKIQEQAAIKAKESRSKFYGNQHVEVCSPNGDHTKIKTDRELAKMAGVGTGIIARYNRVMNSDDEELKLRALISNNFGRRKNNPEKDRKALVTYVELKGYRNGEIGRNHFQQCHNGIPEKLTLDEIAQELNISKRNLQRALRIERKLTDSMIPNTSKSLQSKIGQLIESHPIRITLI